MALQCHEVSYADVGGTTIFATNPVLICRGHRRIVRRALGFADADLRLVIVIRTFDRMPHAVLAVYLESGVFILDNETSDIVRAEEMDSYQPVQSFNTSRGWVHLPS